MENFAYLSLLRKSPLFSEISKENIQKICVCLNARERKIQKGSYIFRAGDDARKVYIIISGSVHILDEDFWGNRTIIETMRAYTLFGEAYTITASEKHIVSVAAVEDSTILEMDPKLLFETCSKECDSHVRLVKNTTFILAKKIVLLTEKLGHIVQRTTREKILSFLSQCARQNQSNSFTIPYTRQQLADYLCIDRSALSHELSRMRASGLIQYRKSQFELFNK